MEEAVVAVVWVAVWAVEGVVAVEEDAVEVVGTGDDKNTHPNRRHGRN
jgi:hypothetical protein